MTYLTIITNCIHVVFIYRYISTSVFEMTRCKKFGDTCSVFNDFTISCTDCYLIIVEFTNSLNDNILTDYFTFNEFICFYNFYRIQIILIVPLVNDAISSSTIDFFVLYTFLKAVNFSIMSIFYSF